VIVYKNGQKLLWGNIILLPPQLQHCRGNRPLRPHGSNAYAYWSNSEWQWHQLGHMQICTTPQTENPASTPLLSFLQAECPSCRRTNSIKALKAIYRLNILYIM